MTMDLQRLVTSVARDVAPYVNEGEVAKYIPALARVDKAQFGIAVRTVDGKEAYAGDALTPFSIQ